MSTELGPSPAPAVFQVTLFTPTPKAARRVLEFFTAQINNDHTRKAYMNATRRFSEWCGRRDIAELTAVQPFHVAAFVKELQGEFAPPTVEPRAGALRASFRTNRSEPSTAMPVGSLTQTEVSEITPFRVEEWS